MGRNELGYQLDRPAGAQPVDSLGVPRGRGDGRSSAGGDGRSSVGGGSGRAGAGEARIWWSSTGAGGGNDAAELRGVRSGRRPGGGSLCAEVARGTEGERAGSRGRPPYLWVATHASPKMDFVFGYSIGGSF